MQDFNPKWEPGPPGDTIKHCLTERHLSIDWLASQLGQTLMWTHNFLEGEEILTHEIAEKLVACIGSSASFWIRREKLYREGWDSLR